MDDELKNSIKTQSLSEARMKAFQDLVGQLEKACTQIQDTVTKVNLKVGEADNLERMVEVFNELHNAQGGAVSKKKGRKHHNADVANLMQAYRRFDSKHQMVKFNHNVHADKCIEGASMLYLFNDIFIVAEEKSKRNPSLFGSKSKFSFVPKSMMKNSLGKGRAPSLTSKNTKTSSLPSPTDISSRRSLRATKATSSSKKSGKTGEETSSLGHELFYEVVVFMTLKSLTKFKTIEEDDKDGVERFGLECYYAIKDKNINEMEVGQIVFWFNTAELRNSIQTLIEKLKEDDTKVKSALELAQKKYAGKDKGARKFKKKHDEHKKSSLQKEQAKKSAVKVADDGTKHKPANEL